MKAVREADARETYEFVLALITLAVALLCFVNVKPVSVRKKKDPEAPPNTLAQT